ncbi:MAG: type II toxin-antitoxin system HigB family toxin [bacterium]
MDLKQRYPKASILKDKYVVFNICGNKYRLLVQVAYNTSIVLIKKIGTHKEYDNWNIS